DGENSSGSRFSPDGRWLAYHSDESGRFEVYVRSFPGPGGKRQVSTGGGGFPVWSRDGKELLHVTLDKNISAGPISPSAEVHTRRPAILFPAQPTSANAFYDVAADGRFLVDTPPTDEGSPPLDLVVNWTSLLAKR